MTSLVASRCVADCRITEALYFFSQDDGAELPVAELRSRGRCYQQLRFGHRPELRGQEELVELQLASQAELGPR